MRGNECGPTGDDREPRDNIGVVALVAVVGYGDAAETIIKATSAIKGEGRFYRATDQHLLFSGYFQGYVEAEKGDLCLAKQAVERIMVKS